MTGMPHDGPPALHCPPDGRGGDDDVGVPDVGRQVALEDAMPRLWRRSVVSVAEIGPGYGIFEIEQDFRDAAHPDAADSHEMDDLIFSASPVLDHILSQISPVVVFVREQTRPAASWFYIMIPVSYRREKTFIDNSRRPDPGKLAEHASSGKSAGIPVKGENGFAVSDSVGVSPPALDEDFDFSSGDARHR